LGQRVLAPLGNRRIIGYLVGLKAGGGSKPLKEIEQVIDREPLIKDALFALSRWLSEYYCCSWGEALATIISPRLGTKHFPAPVQEAFVPVRAPFLPSPEQKEITTELTQAVQKGDSAYYLLHGISDSGKTEIYMEAIAAAIKEKKQSLFLVPEISLSAQMISFLKERFGKEVGIWHSKISAMQRWKVWEQVRKGEIQLVLGTRSAVFLPFSTLGMIIIDEEQEHSYKQESKPMYRTQTVAEVRARLEKAVLVLGSATPSLESYHQALQGKYRLLNLKTRILKRALPRIRVVDMRRGGSRERGGLLSWELSESINRCFQNQEQCIIVINRRGFARTVFCHRCGFILKCPHCSVSLIYHASFEKLVCHYCGKKMGTTRICPQCRSRGLAFSGAGTEKVVLELKRTWPGARILRMDRDTVRKKEKAEGMYQAFRKRRADILVGTQLLAKGWDFPWVSLVGVLEPDASLFLPDFRSAERTFNLLMQVAGRAGRGKVRGEVIIQTYNPDHPSIQAAIQQDYRTFYEQEIDLRRSFNYPPFTHLINLIIRGKKEDGVKRVAEFISSYLKQQHRKIQILGPSPAIRYRLSGAWRWQILVKTHDLNPVRESLSKLMERRLPSGTKLIIDVDPVDLL